MKMETNIIIIKALVDLEEFIHDSYKANGVVPGEDDVLYEVLKILKKHGLEDTDEIMEEMFSEYIVALDVIKVYANSNKGDPLRDGTEVERLFSEEVERMQQKQSQPSSKTCQVISLLTGVDCEEVKVDLINAAYN